MSWELKRKVGKNWMADFIVSQVDEPNLLVHLKLLTSIDWVNVVCRGNGLNRSNRRDNNAGKLELGRR